MPNPTPNLQGLAIYLPRANTGGGNKKYRFCLNATNVENGAKVEIKGKTGIVGQWQGQVKVNGNRVQVVITGGTRPLAVDGKDVQGDDIGTVDITVTNPGTGSVPATLGSVPAIIVGEADLP